MLRRFSLAVPLLFGLLLFAQQRAPVPHVPSYAQDGSLNVPANYREWIYLTSGIDMSYNPQPPNAGQPAHSVFDNVFVNPEAYHAFLATGTWPDRTALIIEVRGAENPVSINTSGHTQSTDIHGLEIHVRDKGRWAFFEGSKAGAPAKLIPQPAACYTCHEAHGAVDTTFVQFYPTLLPIAQEKKTLSPRYLTEIANPAAEAR